jgi:hypothetical protein
MAARIPITVVDVNGFPISGARLLGTSGVHFGTTDDSGNASIGLSPELKLELTISHSSYVTEKVSFQPSVQKGDWDNSLVSRSVTADGTALRVQLGRLATALTVYIADLKLATAPADPGAAILFHPPKFPDQFAYRGQ